MTLKELCPFFCSLNLFLLKASSEKGCSPTFLMSFILDFFLGLLSSPFSLQAPHKPMTTLAWRTRCEVYSAIKTIVSRQSNFYIQVSVTGQEPRKEFS